MNHASKSKKVHSEVCVCNHRPCLTMAEILGFPEFGNLFYATKIQGCTSSFMRIHSDQSWQTWHVKIIERNRNSFCFQSFCFCHQKNQIDSKKNSPFCHEEKQVFECGYLDHHSHCQKTYWGCWVLPELLNWF